MLLLPPGSSFRRGPLELTPELPPTPDASLPDQPTQLRLPRGIGSRLSPVYLRGPHPRRVRCYALFKGWLLLSLPSRCLRTRTPFNVTLSRHLGALTPVWVFPLSERGLTPCIPSPAVFDADSFGVRQTSRGFPPISHQSVLYTIGCLALGLTAASFERNQLSPGLIGLSPLAQGYPTELHIKTGSALHQAKLGFSLPRTRSPRFRVSSP